MKRLKEIRQAKGLTLEKLAERLDMSHAIVQRWESGKRQCPSGRIAAIAKVLGCHPGELFARLPATVPLTAAQKEAAQVADALAGAALHDWLGIGRRLAQGAPATPQAAAQLRLVADAGSRTTAHSTKRPKR